MAYTFQDYRAELSDIAAEQAATAASGRIQAAYDAANWDYQSQREGKPFRPMPEGWANKAAIAASVGLDPHNPYVGYRL